MTLATLETIHPTPLTKKGRQMCRNLYIYFTLNFFLYLSALEIEKRRKKMLF